MEDGVLFRIIELVWIQERYPDLGYVDCNVEPSTGGCLP